jgi:hypothetical protein
MAPDELHRLVEVVATAISVFAVMGYPLPVASRRRQRACRARP